MRTLLPSLYLPLNPSSTFVALHLNLGFIMESQQIATHHHHEAHNVALHQSVVEGEEEDGQHHEKKSVLKKVKAKARKIKDTITKHGHAHGHDHHDYEDEDEDDDEDEGVVEDPELQGAPLYEGAAMRSAVAGQGQQQDIGIGMSTAMHNQPPLAPKETTSRPSAVETGFTSVDKPTAKVDNSAVAPNTTMSVSSWSLEEDPHAPKDKTHSHTPQHFEVKAFDPAGRGNEEAGDSQIFDSFAKMKVNDKDEGNRTGSASGQHQGQGGNQSTYSQKISAVGSAMSGKAVAAKDFVASKLGYGETTEDITNTETKSSSPLEYGKKIASTVTEKLKPGEEDKALAEVISEAFSRRKEEVVTVGESAFSRQAEGKVTESEELSRRLGREDNEGTERSSAASAATATTVRSVVDMMKDTMGPWLGKAGDQPPPSQQSLGTSQGVEGFVDSSAVGKGLRRRQEPGGTEAEGRILQESAN